MTNNWEVKKLGEICGFTRGPFGGSLKKGIFKPDGYAVYEQQHAIYDQFDDVRYFIDEAKFNEMRRFELNPGDLIMSCSGTMGKIAIVPENIKKGIINQALLRLAPSEKVLNVFLKLWMQSESFQDSLKVHSQGAAIQNVASVKILKDIEIPLPPLAEQQRIVAILDEAFAAIAQVKENAEKNLQNARELFDSYLQRVFANSGDGWEVKTLDEVLQKTETVDPTKKPDKEFIYIDVSSVNKENLQIETTTLLKGIDAPSRARKLIKTNDVIFATVRPTLKRIAIIPEEYSGQVCSTGYFVLRAKENLENKLVFYFLQTNSFNEKMEKLQKGASYPAVTDGEVRSQIITYPKNLAEQKTIVEKLDTLSAETKKLENIYRQKINDLDELKKSILQKAFNGELTAKRQVSNVIDFPVRIPNISATDLQAGIVALAFQRHQEKGKVLTFGHVKAEKIVHLAQEILNIELEREPVKDAAGPNDFPRLKKVESRAEKAGFFRTIRQAYGYTYIPGNQFDNLIQKTKTALKDKAEELTKLIDLLVPMDTQQAELIATVYAAWNNLLIDNQTINDETIVSEAWENWHEAKLNIPRERFFNTISWMKQNNLIPTGKGKKVSSRPNRK